MADLVVHPRLLKQGDKEMMPRAIATTVAVFVGVGARAEDTATLLALDDPGVIGALLTAWKQSENGATGFEASFRLDASSSGYEIVAAPFSNQYMEQKLRVIRGKTFAIFHVHPTKGEPEPSPQDRSIADNYKLKMVTLHKSGLYEYDPVMKRTSRLRSGLAWLRPSENTRQAATAPRAALDAVGATF